MVCIGSSDACIAVGNYVPSLLEYDHPWQIPIGSGLITNIGSWSLKYGESRQREHVCEEWPKAINHLISKLSLFLFYNFYNKKSLIGELNLENFKQNQS